MSLLGLLVGILSILFPYTYVYFPSLDRVSAVSLDPRTSFLHASCAIFLYLPLIIITTIFNLISIYKNRFFFKKHKDINNVEFKILLYSCLQLFTMIAFEGYYLVRNIPYIIDNFYFLEAIAIQSLSWIVDSMTYGLFIFSLILSPILRSQLLFLNLKQNNKTIKIKTSNMTQRY